MTMNSVRFRDQKDPKDTLDLKVSKDPQVVQDVEISTVSLVIQETLVSQGPEDLMDTKGPKESKVARGNVSVGLVVEGQGPQVHLGIQDPQGYLELKA